MCDTEIGDELENEYGSVIRGKYEHTMLYVCTKLSQQSPLFYINNALKFL